MNESELPPSVLEQTYPSAAKGVADSHRHTVSPQTESAAYQLAFAGHEFLLRDEMRGVRLQLEYQKADLVQRELGIESTVVIFGGARILEPAKAVERLREAEAALEESPDDPERKVLAAVARRLVESSRFYGETVELARLASTSCQIRGECHFVVATGGGPGIMEAANRGADECGAKSIGHNIVLPMEQAPNRYITPELCFQFHYFALRKLHFMMRAKALVCFPGGYGTMDELFEALTLIQTRKIARIPVILVGREFWERAVDFDFLVEEGLVSHEDLGIFRLVETGAEAWDEICRFHALPMGNR